MFTSEQGARITLLWHRAINEFLFAATGAEPCRTRPSQKEMNHLPAIDFQVVVRFWGVYFFVDVDFGNWLHTGDRSVNDSTVILFVFKI